MAAREWHGGRAGSKERISLEGGSPASQAARSSPTAGAVLKPVPLQPQQSQRPERAEGPTRGRPSGVMSSIPARRPTVAAPSAEGTRRVRRAAASATKASSTSGRAAAAEARRRRRHVLPPTAVADVRIPLDERGLPQYLSSRLGDAETTLHDASASLGHDIEVQR